ncbi:MAG: choice-of-anchor B family protein [Bacteroidetes bacterium]|nr:choice-of-anchor B family protein [Bacteroidota bacterium]
MSIKSQVYPSQNINLVGYLNPNTNTATVGPDGRYYSGCWGWYQASKNKEYAISGTSNGAYFIDITLPTTPSISAFVQGKNQCTWREIKTYKNICYIASDDQSPNNFQIVDMQYLPDSVHLIYSGTSYFERGHTLWVDSLTQKLYVGAATYSGSAGFSPMNIYSIVTPSAPILLRQLSQDVPSISYVHDMYARNDTIYASCGNQGLYVLHATSGGSITQLGSYTGYANAGYNHSSFLTQNGKYLVFCDEIPASLPAHIVDVSNLLNINPIADFHPYQQTTPHNPYLIGNSTLFLSSYQDGLLVYNISNPSVPCKTGYFDTYPQFGFNYNTAVDNYNSSVYRGNWGAYPWLPSGLVIANDMQNGVFILDPSAAKTATNCITVGINENLSMPYSINLFPNPVSDFAAITSSYNGASTVSIIDISGNKLFEKKYFEKANDYIDLRSLSNGLYFLTFEFCNTHLSKKIIINH